VYLGKLMTVGVVFGVSLGKFEVVNYIVVEISMRELIMRVHSKFYLFIYLAN